jgi:class 3 adenylate cyclase
MAAGHPGAIGNNRRVGELPTGTITLLFSDIEGSTALVRRLGERYGEALSAHRTLLRAAFRSFGGRELSTEGDSFFVVFESAIAATGCCVAGQRARCVPGVWTTRSGCGRSWTSPAPAGGWSPRRCR